MKPRFTDSPDAWLRASRVHQSAADYASPVERFERKGHAAAFYVGAVILAVLSLLLITGRF